MLRPEINLHVSLQDRLSTLAHVRKAGISVCAGGIIGMGEASLDRVGLLHQLATLPEHPESVPINALIAVKGTPLQAGLLLSLRSVVTSIWQHAFNQ